MAAKLLLRVATADEVKRVRLPGDAGERQFRGVPLRRLREMLGGDEGHLPDPTDPSIRHPVSLARWAQADPDNTYFWVEWEMVAPAGTGTRTRSPRPRP